MSFSSSCQYYFFVCNVLLFTDTIKPSTRRRVEITKTTIHLFFVKQTLNKEEKDMRNMSQIMKG